MPVTRSACGVAFSGGLLSHESLHKTQSTLPNNLTPRQRRLPNPGRRTTPNLHLNPRIFTYAPPPPSASEFLSIIEQFGLPRRIYRDPFYSRKVDVPWSERVCWACLSPQRPYTGRSRGMGSKRESYLFRARGHAPFCIMWWRRLSGGVGVAGWLLSGGYSLKTNQYGLGINSILQPGGDNNFGIVTEFTVRVHIQAKPTCGCLLQYEVEDFEEVKTAVVNFAQQEDPKASIVAAFRYYCSPGGIQIHMPVELPDLRVLPPPKWSELVVYDNYHFFDYQTSFVNEALDVQDVQVDEIESPHPLPIATWTLLKPQTVQVRRVVAADQSASIETLLPQSQDHIKRAMAGVGENPRGRWGNVIVDIYTIEIIDEIGGQASKAAREIPGHSGKRVVIDIWPFTETMFNNATECAWPHVKDQPNGPILAYFLWEGSENDNFWIQQMERAMKAIKKKVDKARGPPRNRSQSTRTRR
ncbi:hypothetical protein L210DRAFT_3509833 [Boletus edulis BED1]|uniref:Uncharacterized protein n=1 Tax=Boletus edulis BED1 TaxID=1328754 RepID=A0AAD4G806_BOLED|nr:hypothetical protein L210DRAFT_3509833 [Boletus edulis BED1]